MYNFFFTLLYIYIDVTFRLFIYFYRLTQIQEKPDLEKERVEHEAYWKVKET